MSTTVVSPVGLADLRNRAGITAGNLAERLGVTERAVYAWEHRDAALSAQRIVAIAAALGLGDVDTLALTLWAGTP